MKVHGTTATMAMLLLLASGQSQAAADRPLDLGLAAPLAQPQQQQPAFVNPRPIAHQPGIGAAFNRSDLDRPLLARPPLNRNKSRTEVLLGGTGTRLRDGALQVLLEPQAPTFDEERGSGRLQLKFQKRGNALRDLRKSYRDMCNNVSEKIWDEPNGKHVRFDVAGKPGFAVELPIH